MFLYRSLALFLFAAPLVAQAEAFDLPDIPQCTELSPGAIATDSTPVKLGVRVLLDGVSQGQAVVTMATAQGSYTPLGVSLAPSYEYASFSSSDGQELINEAKRHYGGSRPAGTQLVFVLTNKDLTDGGVAGTALVGLADCIGGVAYADSAFAVGEEDDESGAKTMAHELGHLLGAQHHYANCAEAVAKGGDNVCTLMINDVGLAALPFSSTNGIVVRGHAQIYGSADPNGVPAAAADSPRATSSGSLGWLSLGLLACASLRRRGRA